jgi:carbon-monoxide dehydrogenase medium subunit
VTRKKGALVIPPPFDYHAPSTLDEAIALMAKLGDAAKILAGGQSLIPAMRFRLTSPDVLVDINRIPELGRLEERDGHLVIGALVREHELDESTLVEASYPLLHDTTRVIADPLVRNHATVGGNLAHSDPANDHPATMLAYDAKIVARGPKGARTIAIDDFFTGLFENSLAPGEILTEIRIPKPGAGAGGAYLKLERKVGDFAVAAVAVQLVHAGGKLASIRIGLTNVSPVPMRAKQAEALLAGKAPDATAVDAASRAAAAECDPSPDLRGGVDYKRDMIRVLTKRAIRKALHRAGGGK